MKQGIPEDRILDLFFFSHAILTSFSTNHVVDVGWLDKTLPQPTLHFLQRKRAHYPNDCLEMKIAG
jgi:hypothetical protein